MLLCNTDCIPVCDFCRHYNFNANRRGTYVEKGFCRYYGKKKDPGDMCKNFWCFKAIPSIQKRIEKKHQLMNDYTIAYRVWKEWAKKTLEWSFEGYLENKLRKLKTKH